MAFGVSPEAFRHWLKMKQPDNWANFDYPNIDFQNISYYQRAETESEKGEPRRG
jgi:hypothetical protein